MRTAYSHIRLSKWTLSLFLVIAFLMQREISLAQSIYYVNVDAEPGGDGLQWSSAFKSLQDALDAACMDDLSEIWVAKGTYLPSQNRGDSSTGPMDRTNTFVLCNHVALYGGFQGDEVSKEDRDWELNVTTLSGDIDSFPDVDSANAYNVISIFFADTSTRLDGFTITGGYADNTENNPEFYGSGGGITAIKSHAKLQHCIFKDNYANYGGGLNADSSALHVKNCVFENNHCLSNFGYGGGASLFEDTTTFENCAFNLNTSKWSGGGLSIHGNSSPELIQCSFQENISPRGGALSTNSTVSFELDTCLFSGNKGEMDGGALYIINTSHAHLNHCVFNENETPGNGGAVYLSGSGQFSMSSCDFLRNKANDGGGLSQFFSQADIFNTHFRANVSNNGGAISSRNAMLHIQNSILSGNVVRNFGGAIFSYSSVALIKNTTISGNSSRNKGGALYTDSVPTSTGYTRIDNSIIWNNRAAQESSTASASIFNLLSSSMIISSSIIANSGGSENWDGSFGIDGKFNLDTDPFFEIPIVPDTLPNINGDFHLLASSTGINKGSLDTTGLYVLSYDADQLDRIVDGRIDIGAYEYQQESMNPICNISGPDIVTAFTISEFFAPAGMDSYSWTIRGNAKIIGSNDSQEIQVLADAVNSFLITLTVMDPDGIETTCAYKVQISSDCNFYNDAHVIYVNKNASGNNNGTSWSDAFTELKDALQLACPVVEEIWVAGGTYYPEYDSPDRLVTFQLKNGLKLYGGFQGNETMPEERNWLTNETILSGDRDRDNLTMMNTYNVVVGSGTNNTAVLDGFTITGGKADSYVNGLRESAGAGVYIADGSPMIRNCKISLNTSANGGAGLCNFHASPTISDCTFFQNTVSDGDSGGMKNSASSSPIITGCFFIENKASRSAAGMGNYASSPSIMNCDFEKNEVGSGQGGGMLNGSATPILINCKFTANAARNGAGMYNSTSSPVLENCMFTNNKGRDGCGIYNLGGSSPSLTGCHFTGHKTSSNGKGAGMFNQFQSAPVLTACVFEDNHANDYGGGMHNSASNPVLIDCIFINNEADEDGGGGMSNLKSFPVLTGCRFEHNKSFLYGGGLLNDQGSSVNMNLCHFTGNSAIQGGGFYLRDDTVTIINNSLFESNEAFGAGGALQIWDSSPSVSNCVFRNNKSDIDGGAIATDDNAVINLVNCIIAGNHAVRRGGGINSEGASSLRLINSTLSTNESVAEGGAINNEGAEIKLTNSIIWNNRSGGQTQILAASIANDSIAFSLSKYSLIANSGGSDNWDVKTGIDLGNNIDEDPFFQHDGIIDTFYDLAMDLHLQEISPAINTGTPDTSGLFISLTDADGQPRVIQSRIDMGAFEFQDLVRIHPVEEHLNWFISPNPANDLTTINHIEEISEIAITDCKGQIIFHENNLKPDLTSVFQLQVSSWPSGTYTIYLMKAGILISSKKLIVIKE